MKTLKSLSLFFPAYNDARSIPDLVKRAGRAAKQVTRSFEIIIVNDGSTDNTITVVEKLKRRYRNLRLITHDQNRGYGAALISGFAAATYEWVFYTDGDGQYDPSELSRLVSSLTPTTDVVNGYKINRADPWFRTIIGTTYNWLLHLFYPLPIRDLDCDFRLIRRSMVQKIQLTKTSGTICLELIRKLDRSGARFADVPIHHYPRRFGKSEFFRLRHLLNTLKEWIPV